MLRKKYTATDCKLCLYNPTSARIIDLITPNNIAIYSRKPLQQFLLDYVGELEILDFDEAYKRQNDACKTDVSEISEDDWWEALECLPPIHWRGGLVESFQCSEMWSGNVTDTYVQYGGKYYTFRDTRGISEEDIFEKLTKFISDCS